jgi:hypothetical protein
METKEYRDILDKSEWGAGDWQHEPDKVQWPDEATGLACLAVRGPHGGWCGYVGVAPSHPWHTKDYSTCVVPTLHESHEGGEENYHFNCTPEGILRVHGGVTFADSCADLSRKEWQQVKTSLPKWAAEALVYPRGDSARRLKTYAPLADSFEKWQAYKQATSICHLPAPGEPDNVWWFGFDCAHSGDHSPAYDRGPRYRGIYRTLEYVRGQCRSLAKQLADVAHSSERTSDVSI